MRWLLFTMFLSGAVLLQGCSFTDVHSYLSFDEDGKAIVSAARWRSESRLKKVLSKGVSIDTQGSAGITPLMLLAVNNETKAVRFLIQHGASMDLEDDDGKTALVYAVQANSSETLKMMLNNGGDVSQISNGRTLLLRAMHRDDDYDEFASVILDAGADINQLMSSYGSGTETLLNTMVNLNFFERVRYLVEKGADPTIPNGINFSPIQMLETDDVTLLSDRGKDRYFALVHWLKAQGYKIKIQPDPRKAHKVTDAVNVPAEASP